MSSYPCIIQNRQQKFRIALIKKIVSRLPARLQRYLKAWYYHYQIDHVQFRSPELEFNCLDKWITEDDWVLDIGANVGHYTLRLSSLVGSNGRVIAFEPVIDSFYFLTNNIFYSDCNNVTLLNVGASNLSSMFGIEIPSTNDGRENFYEAHFVPSNNTVRSTLAISVDDLNLPNRIALVKIDAEGHDLRVLQGMRKLLVQDRPVLIVESHSPEVIKLLKSLGYRSLQNMGSPNLVFEHIDNV